MKDRTIRHTSTAALRAARSFEAWLALATGLLAASCGTGQGNVDAPASGDGMSSAGAAPGSEQTGPDAPNWRLAERVLEAKCWRCHAAPPTHGAPFALVSYDDTQVVNAHGTPRFVTIEKVVRENFMPPSFIDLEPPVAALTDAEKQTLLDWCRAGASAEPAP